MEKIIIAIDGHSSCGKSTLAKDLAQTLKYTYIDTGAMYRAVALYFMRTGDLSDKKANTSAIVTHLDEVNVEFRYDAETDQSTTWLNGENVEEEIRGVKVSENVSVVSQLPEVRAKLVQLQQEMGKHGGIVMDGRDIGTRVFPQAELKLFVTAELEVRAQRRYDQMVAKGLDVSFDEVAENLKERDFNDEHRGENPLQKAADAVEIDNTNISISEQYQLALDLARERMALAG